MVEIQSLSCPSCGSVKVEKIKEKLGHWRCIYCGRELIAHIDGDNSVILVELKKIEKKVKRVANVSSNLAGEYYESEIEKWEYGKNSALKKFLLSGFFGGGIFLYCTIITFAVGGPIFFISSTIIWAPLLIYCFRYYLLFKKYDAAIAYHNNKLNEAVDIKNLVR